MVKLSFRELCDSNFLVYMLLIKKPVSTDLTIKPDSVLTNPVGKDGVQNWLMIPSLEGQLTKAKEAPSPHEVRLVPLTPT